MRHHNLQVTGSVSVNGISAATAADLGAYTGSNDTKISTLQAFTASVGTTNTFTASASGRLNSIETISASNIARINAIEIVTSSNVARLNALETTSASVDTLNTTQNTRLTSLEIKTGSLATTGSNTFFGTQTITGSLYISSDLIVQGSSSLQNITASAVSIGTNLINLNTANPAIRYAGLVIGDSGSIGSSGSFLYDSVQDEFIFVHRGANSTVTSSVVLMGPETYDSLGNETYLTGNRIPKGKGNEHLIDSNISDDGTTIVLNSNTIITGSLIVGKSEANDNSDYSIGIFRHGTSISPGTASIVPGLQIADYAGDGRSTYNSIGLLDISTPRISNSDTNAGNTQLIRVANDDMTMFQISAKGRVFVGQDSQTDNGQTFQVNGTSRFDGTATFTGQVNVGTDLGLIGNNPRIDYPNGSYFRIYQTGVGTKFYIDTSSNFTFYGTGVDSPKLILQGLSNTTAMIGDTSTGTTDIGNLWLYNDGALKIRLDSDTAGTSFIDANKFVIGATTSTNAKFRVRHDDTDATYTSKIQAVFGPSDYLDSDATDVFGGGTSETQFTNGNTARPAMISLGGSLNTAEALGVINFFRSGNSDNYRSRVQLWAGVQSTGTANQHGGYLEIRTANDGVAAPAALAQFEARGSFLLYRRNDNMTFADSVGALYVRQNGNHAGTEEEFRIVGRNIGFFSHTGTRHAGINSSGVLGIGYGGTPAATSKIFISRSDQYGLHLDAGSGYARIQTTDDNLYLKVGSNDMITINSSAITLTSTVTPSNVSTPNFAILETGVSKSVTGYNYDATQPMAMVITQTAQTTMGLMRASEDTVGSTLRGMKARGNASTIASPLNGDDIFSVEGWAWHGSGPNYPKLGGGMKFVKDDNWGTASTRAPMRTEFYNANSTTTTQTTLIIYPSGNASLTGTLTQSASDIRLKTNITKIENALDKINQLEGFTYNWNTISPLYNSNVTNKEVGLSAQAVREVLPEVVSLAPFDVDNLDGKTSKSGENYLTVNYEKLVPLLIEGIKELKAENNSLQLQIDELRSK